MNYNKGNRFNFFGNQIITRSKIYMYNILKAFLILYLRK